MGWNETDQRQIRWHLAIGGDPARQRPIGIARPTLNEGRAKVQIHTDYFGLAGKLAVTRTFQY